MTSFLDILVLLFVVFFIFNKLRAVLGTRPDNVETIKIAEKNAAKIFDIIMSEQEKNLTENTLVVTEAKDLSDLDKALAKIPGFDKTKFVNSAQKVFEMILKAFAKGDAKTLEMLVSKNLYNKFLEVIEDRNTKKISAEADFIGFDKVELLSANISKSEVAKIKVEFVSQQVNLLKDEKGQVVEGDDRFIQKITDIWTFERALHSNNPNWMLVSTKK